MCKVGRCSVSDAKSVGGGVGDGVLMGNIIMMTYLEYLSMQISYWMLSQKTSFCTVDHPT